MLGLGLGQPRRELRRQAQQLVEQLHGTLYDESGDQVRVAREEAEAPHRCRRRQPGGDAAARLAETERGARLGGAPRSRRSGCRRGTRRRLMALDDEVLDVEQAHRLRRHALALSLEVGAMAGQQLLEIGGEEPAGAVGVGLRQAGVEARGGEGVGGPMLQVGRDRADLRGALRGHQQPLADPNQHRAGGRRRRGRRTGGRQLVEQCRRVARSCASWVTSASSTGEAAAPEPAAPLPRPAPAAITTSSPR